MLLKKLGSCLDSHLVTLGVKRRLGKPEAGPRPGFRFWDNRLRHFALVVGSPKPGLGPASIAMMPIYSDPYSVFF